MKLGILISGLIITTITLKSGRKIRFGDLNYSRMLETWKNFDIYLLLDLKPSDRYLIGLRWDSGLPII